MFCFCFFCFAFCYKEFIIFVAVCGRCSRLCLWMCVHFINSSLSDWYWKFKKKQYLKSNRNGKKKEINTFQCSFFSFSYPNNDKWHTIDPQRAQHRNIIARGKTEKYFVCVWAVDASELNGRELNHTLIFQLKLDEQIEKKN